METCLTPFPNHEGIPGLHPSGLFVADRNHRKIHDAWRYRVSKGTAVKVVPGCYLDREVWAAAQPSDRYRLTAMAKALKHRRRFLMTQAAASVHGLPLSARTSRIELGSPGNRRNSTLSKPDDNLLILGKHRPIPPEGLVLPNGVAATSQARTAADIAAGLSRNDTLARGLMVMDAVIRRGVTKEELTAHCTDTLGRARGPRCFECIEAANNRSDSPLEAFAKAVFLDADLPEFYQQAWVADDSNRVVGVVDFYFPEFFLAVEADGGVKYDGTYGDPERVRQMQHDRHVEIENLGHRIIRVKWTDIASGEAVRKIREAIEMSKVHPRHIHGSVGRARRYKRYDGSYRWG